MQIKTTVKQYDKTCTVATNLIQNQMVRPEIRDIITYAEPRMLSTLIVSGAVAPWQTVIGSTEVKTKIGMLEKGNPKLIGDFGYRYKIMGRIQMRSIINGLVGTPTADGFFQLSIRDKLIYPGMNVIFYDRSIQARCFSEPTGTTGAYIYTFQTHDGSLFNYNTAVAPQTGVKSCFGAFTTYGEKSLRGYARTHYPNDYINHITTQRKSLELSGDALTTVLWLEYNNTKGWLFERQRQSRIQFMMEDEHAKWFGRSTMRSTTGELLDFPSQKDEKGNYIWAGEGVVTQLEGGNEMWGSGINGYADIDDFTDMMTMLEKKSNAIMGKRWVVVTGTSGYANAQVVLRDYFLNTAGRMNQDNNPSDKKAGGVDVVVGGNFDTLNFCGNQITFVKHPLFDDEERWAARASDGEVIQGGMYVFLDMGMNQDGAQNVEILGRGAYGINRTMITTYLNGITGFDAPILHGGDFLEFLMFKQDGIFVYNTSSCGIIHRSQV